MQTVKTLTLIDDDPVYVFLTKKIIESTNLVHVVKVFGNGLEALNFLKENMANPDLMPDIIFLDLFMPIMDGWQFLEEYIMLNPRLSKKITLYVVSSSISPDDINRAKSISVVSDFLIKPIGKNQFVEMIENL